MFHVGQADGGAYGVVSGRPGASVLGHVQAFVGEGFAFVVPAACGALGFGEGLQEGVGLPHEVPGGLQVGGQQAIEFLQGAGLLLGQGLAPGAGVGVEQGH